MSNNDIPISIAFLTFIVLVILSFAYIVYNTPKGKGPIINYPTVGDKLNDSKTGK